MDIPREKLALLIFFVLIILGLGALVGYIHLGHSWNLAASSIDDATGTMDGYAVIIYEGTVSIDADEPSLSGPEEQGQHTSIPPRSVSPAKILGKTTATIKDSVPLELEDIVEEYIQKKANVFSLDLLDERLYQEGLILRKGSHRIAVISVGGSDTALSIENKVKQLSVYKADFLVVLTPDIELLNGISGIDIAISSQKENLSLLGETKNSIFYISAPALHSVGVIFVSPSNIVSAKVLDA